VKTSMSDLASDSKAWMAKCELLYQPSLQETVDKDQVRREHPRSCLPIDGAKRIGMMPAWRRSSHSPFGIMLDAEDFANRSGKARADDNRRQQRAAGTPQNEDDAADRHPERRGERGFDARHRVERKGPLRR
jgi:hypothetical protein